MNTRNSSLVAAALVLAASVALATDVSAPAGDTFVVDRVHSEVSFRVRHLIAKVQGRFDDFTGTLKIVANKPEASSIEFSIKAASINTANEGRDRHLRSADFFEVEKFPEITFKSTKVVPVDADTFNVTGVFTMHGTSRELTLSVEYAGMMKDARGRTKAGFSLETKLNRKDYGIVYNTALETGGFVLGDDVEVSINLAFAQQAPQPPPAPSPAAVK